jgi:DUF4097 and DUF4098 domain-containing protein YvlB
MSNRAGARRGSARAHRLRHGPAAALLLLAAALGTTARALAADRSQSFTFHGEELVIADLIGRVEVTGNKGDAFEVEVQVHGRDASDAQPRIETTEGSHAQLSVRFPLEQERAFIYPELGPDSQCNFRIRDAKDREGEHRRWLDALLAGFAGRKVEVKGSGFGLEMWADVHVKVPSGARLEVDLGVGRIDARGVGANLRLALKSGPLRTANVDGDVWLDTGAGDVQVDGVHGRLDVDTGSGQVDVSDVEGDLHVDTGSGNVSARGCRGEKFAVDTGSGDVQLDRVQCRDFEVDTGSGGVEAGAVSAERLTIDTGSGAVSLQLDALQRGAFKVDTGAGTITLDLPDHASARIKASTGSGEVRVDVKEARTQHLARDEVELVVGGGEAQVVLDTSSGGVRIRQRGRG